MTEGPLDAFIPGLRRSGPAPEAGPFHPRVLHLGGARSAAPGADEATEWMLIAWDDPGGLGELHRGAAALVEAALLAELCRPPSSGRALERPADTLRLLQLSPIAGADGTPAAAAAVGRALAAFGFTAAAWDADIAEAVGEILTEEARTVGRPAPGKPVGVWCARINRAPGELGQALTALQRDLAGRLGDRVWGDPPGAVADALRELRPDLVSLGSAGLDRLERFLGREAHGGIPAGDIRWIPPLFFQALCDLVGVVASAEHGAQLEWGVSAPDELGFADPPVFRQRRGDGFIHIPIAEHLLRWSVMPRRAGEQVPPLSAWVAHQFGQ